MLSALKSLFGGREKSGSVANKRLQMVLIHDRASVSPEVMEKMRDDIIQVISKYVVINKQDMELSLQNEDSAVALVASIPVRRMKHQ